MLPVDLIEFKARAEKDHIALTWLTASELNNSHFEIERSEDGKIFKQIGQISGKGTTVEETDYQFMDEAIVLGTLYYYRLKQVDFDGQFEYSEIRTAQVKSDTESMVIYPNPIGIGQQLNVRFQSNDHIAAFFIQDVQGKYVQSIIQDLPSKGQHTISIDIAHLAAGTYLLTDDAGNTIRFVKSAD